MSDIGDPMTAAPPSTVGGAPTTGYWQVLRSWMSEVHARLEGAVSRLAAVVTQDNSDGTSVGLATYDTPGRFTMTAMGRMILRGSFVSLYTGSTYVMGVFSTVVQIYKGLDVYGQTKFIRGAQQIVAAGDTIAVPGTYIGLNTGTALSTTMTSTPTIAAPAGSATIIILVNEGNGDIVLQDVSVLPGSGMVFTAGTFTLKPQAPLMMVYSIAQWRQLTVPY